MFGLIEKEIITLLSFSESLSCVVKVINRINRISLAK